MKAEWCACYGKWRINCRHMKKVEREGQIMINAHSHIKMPEMKFWKNNYWKENICKHFEFTLFSYRKCYIIGKGEEYSLYALMIFNFEFVLKIRRT
jgi:hypothetical protein